MRVWRAKVCLSEGGTVKYQLKTQLYRLSIQSGNLDLSLSVNHWLCDVENTGPLGVGHLQGRKMK